MNLKAKVGQRIFRKVTFKLTLMHLSLFTAASLVIFLLIYLSLASTLRARVDENLRDDVREYEALFKAKGLKRLQKEFINESKANGNESEFYLLLSPEHHILASSDLNPWRGVNLTPKFIEDLQEGQEIIKTRPQPGHEHEVRVIYKRIKGKLTLEVGNSLRDNDEILERIGEIFNYGFLAMLLMGALLGWLIARHAMSGVERITETARRIERGNLNWRVSVGQEGQEIEELAKAFNSMLDRVELLVTDLEEVTNNIAHDLRGPLTRIRGYAEGLLTKVKPLSEIQEGAGIIIEACDQLLQMINNMLTIAQADSGLSTLSKERVNLGEIEREVADLFLPAAEDKGIILRIIPSSATPPAQGDPLSLKRVTANLLDNAIKFSGKGDSVTLTTGSDGTGVFLEIKDTGVGIDATDLPHIFDRFYRGDKNRSQPGNGLGLSLSLALVRAQGGDITVSSIAGTGSTFRVHLPVYRESSQSS